MECVGSMSVRMYARNPLIVERGDDAGVDEDLPSTSPLLLLLAVKAEDPTTSWYSCLPILLSRIKTLIRWNSPTRGIQDLLGDKSCF